MLASIGRVAYFVYLYISKFYFRTVEELDKLVKDILGVYFLVTTLTLCSVAFRLNTVRNIYV